MLRDDTSRDMLDHCSSLLETNDVNQALSSIVSVLHRAGQSMKCRTDRVKKQVVNKRKNNKEWWDKECQIAKTNKELALRQYRSLRTNENLQTYIREKRAFKTLCDRKEFVFKRILFQNSFSISLFSRYMGLSK